MCNKKILYFEHENQAVMFTLVFFITCTQYCIVNIFLLKIKKALCSPPPPPPYTCTHTHTHIDLFEHIEATTLGLTGLLKLLCR